MLQMELREANKILRHKSPDEIIKWAITISNRRIVTTSFGVYSAVLLSTFYRNDKDIDVVWCDTGFNNPETYKHANYLIKRFSLNIHIYSPLVSAAYLQSLIGIPTLENPKHEDFSELVKLEPFRRALKKHKPAVWFTNIRNRQTEFRNSKDILSFSKDGILKVSPYFYWTDRQLDDYLKQHNLPKNVNYFDPTKVLVNRECGIHLQ